MIDPSLLAIYYRFVDQIGQVNESYSPWAIFPYVHCWVEPFISNVQVLSLWFIFPGFICASWPKISAYQLRSLSFRATICWLLLSFINIFFLLSCFPWSVELLFPTVSSVGCSKVWICQVLLAFSCWHRLTICQKHGRLLINWDCYWNFSRVIQNFLLNLLKDRHSRCHFRWELLVWSWEQKVEVGLMGWENSKTKDLHLRRHWDIIFPSFLSGSRSWCWEW